jgi:hypothetical protein
VNRVTYILGPKMQNISSLDEELLDSQGICSMELLRKLTCMIYDSESGISILAGCDAM